MVHMYHKDGIHVDMPMGRMASPGAVVCGEYASKIIASSDSYYPFKKQLDEFVKWLRTGEIDYPFEDTIEMAKIIIAGIRSREEGGRRVYLSEIHER